MIRRLLSVCVGAVLVSAFAAPARIAAKPPDLPEDGTFTLKTAREPFASFFRPWSIRKVDSTWYNLPQPTVNSGVLSDAPRDRVAEAFGCSDCTGGWSPRGLEEWRKWIFSHWTHWTARQQLPPSEQNEGYVRPIASGVDFAYQAATDTPASENETPAPVIEVLPMPQEEPEVTCPYLRQQRIDRHACQIADAQIGRDVFDNLKLLEEADKLIELAKNLAKDGFLDEAMECCARAAEMCPGSPCAARADAAMIELALGSVPPSKESEEAAEAQPHEPIDQVSEPGSQAMVSGLMKACHLLMNQGMQHQAAELARQAYALDPQRVMSDPLIYKMHLLAESPGAQPVGASEESEPQTCPYCPSAGKPIREIVPKKKKSYADDTSLIMPPLIETMPFEIAANAEGELHLNADCPLGGNVYHVRYTHGCLKIWRTADDSGTKP
jgi:hypothetical protein